MSKRMTKQSSGNGQALLDRARGVVDVAVPAGQQARDSMVSGMNTGVHRARIWTAPRMEELASVVESRITPAVTSSLRSSAKKIRPHKESRIRAMTHGMASWRGLVALFAVLGVAGAAAGMAMRKRYSSATAEAEKASTDETTVLPGKNGERPSADDQRVGSGSNW